MKQRTPTPATAPSWRSMPRPKTPLRAALTEALQGGATLLDIGAGAGRYAVPLARIASHVTAVEPSPFMRGLLTRRLAEAGVDNVSIVPEPWPEAEVETHDVSLCSHAMFSAPDVEAFISKLDRCGRRACFLATRVDQRVAPFDQLYPEIVGERWAPEPDFLDLYAALFAMGIRAHVQIVPWGRGYPTIDEVVEDARRQLGLNLQDRTHDARLREFAQEATVERDGRVEFKVPRHAAIIWWEKQG